MNKKILFLVLSLLQVHVAYSFNWIALTHCFIFNKKYICLVGCAGLSYVISVVGLSFTDDEEIIKSLDWINGDIKDGVICVPKRLYDLAQKPEEERQKNIGRVLLIPVNLIKCFASILPGVLLGLFISSKIK